MIDLVEVESGNVPEDGPQSSVGDLLASARQKSGLKIEAVADRLKLSVNTIEAVEFGDMKALPPRSFVQGYVRAYAKLVGLDENVVLPLWEKEFPRQEREAATPSEPANRRMQRMRRSMAKTPVGKKRTRRGWVFVAVLLPLVVIFGILSTLDKPKLTSNHVLPQLPQQAVVSDHAGSHVIPVLASHPQKSSRQGAKA